MTEPSGTNPSPPTEPIPTGQPTQPAQPSAAPLPGESPIDAYVRENHLRFAEPAIRQALLSAGNHPDAVERALARYRGDPGSIGAGRRSAKVLLVIYAAVFALLSVGMLANAGNFGDQYLGSMGAAIFIWAIVVAAGFGASMIWVASRRVGILFIGMGVAVAGVSLMAGSALAGLVVLIAGIAMIAVAIVAGERIDRGISTSAPVMLSVPLLILLALGGACVATGLPFGTS